jgi:site-specific DNA recombinase
MQKAIGYVRISTEDQSNFSIDGQEKQIIDYCIKNKIELSNVFKDEGQSAKNFNRLDWINLEKFIQKNYANVDVLIVAKYDRFSRNVSEALQMIDKLEKKYSITIISVMEHIGLHPKSPYFFQFRTQMLLGADVELRVIKDRTKFGIYSANKNGRWVNAAPYGYTNARDEQNKPIILIAPERAAHIKEIFALYNNATPAEAIRKIMLQKGFTKRGSSAIQEVIANPVYCGLIKVHSYYDEPEQLVKGIHEPIISQEDWWKAQSILHQKKGLLHTFNNDEVPLRGVVKCHCNKLLTAGNSKSRNGNYYWYYKCSTHPTPNFRADTLHSKFDDILNMLSFTEQHIEIITQKAKEKLNISMLTQQQQLKEAKYKLKEIIANIDSLEEKYITNNIDRDTYYKWKPKLVADKATTVTLIEGMTEPINNVVDRFSENLHKLSNISWLYNQNTTLGKQAFIKIVFDNTLYYTNDIYRTKTILPIFLSKALVLKQKNLLIVEKIFAKSDTFVESAQLRNSIEPLLHWLNTFKIA